MKMQRAGILCVFAMLLAAFVLSSCSDSPTSPAEKTGQIDTTGQSDTTHNTDTTTTPTDTIPQVDTTGAAADTVIDWVTTQVLYNPSMQKHDLSLLFVMASWCSHCQHLKAYTLTDSSVIATINHSFNAAYVHIDSFKNVYYYDTLVTEQVLGNVKYDVHSYPTIFVLEPNGDTARRWIGDRPAAEFVDSLNAVLSGQ